MLHDDARGLYAYDTVYNDADADQIASLPTTQMHRNVDVEIVAADEQGLRLAPRRPS